MAKLFFFLLICLCPLMIVHAQIYVEGVGGILPLDLCNCTTGAAVMDQGSAAIAVGNTPNPYYIANGAVFSHDVSTNTSTQVALFDVSTNNLVYGPDGFLYTVADDGTNIMSLYTINPVNGDVVNLGNLPAGIFMQGDLFFFNGLLYGGAELNGQSIIIQIPVNDPGGTFIVFDFPNFSGFMGTATVILNGVQTVILSGDDSNTGQSGLFSLNMTTGEYILLCPNIAIFDLGARLNYQVPVCCDNYAGTFASYAPVTLCENETFSPVHNGDEELTSGSILRFILVSDTSAILPNAVISVSSSPNFSFNPSTMTTNAIYYVAAIAAPNNNGVPQWNASCKDLTFFIPVVWKPVPTVSLSGTAPSLCATGCAAIQLNFSGAFPVSLNWSVNTGAQVITGIWTATESPATFTFCAPGSGLPLGNLPLSFVSLSDQFCTCN